MKKKKPKKTKTGEKNTELGKENYFPQKNNPNKNS